MTVHIAVELANELGATTIPNRTLRYRRCQRCELAFPVS